MMAYRASAFVIVISLLAPMGLALPNLSLTSDVASSVDDAVIAESLGLGETLANTRGIQDSLVAAAVQLAEAPGLAQQFGLVAGVPVAPAPDTTSLAAALSALHDAAGLAPPDLAVLPPEPLASALAPLVAAIAEAARLRASAFEDLSLADQAYLFDNLDALLPPAVPGDERRADAVAALLDRVDVTLLHQGAARVLSAIDAFPRDLPIGSLPSSITCLSGCMIQIGDMADDTYTTEAVLIVDLGGSDVYDNRAATWAPGSAWGVGVSVLLDLGGSDTYTTTTPHPSFNWMAAGQGVGLGGIGILVDVRGDDDYSTTLVNGNTGPCVNDGAGGFQTRRNFVYAQGVGVAGVGVLADSDGRDEYRAHAEDSAPGACHFGKAFAFAQGGATHGGIGLLADGADNDFYQTTTYATGTCDPFAHTYAQGFAGDAIGVLLDAGGHDVYNAQAYATYNPQCVKGAFAYAFAQGTTFLTRHNPAPGAFLSGVGQSLFGAAVAACPVIPQLAGVQVEPCRPLSVGVLADVYGQDSYSIYSYAWNDINCGSYVWANSIGQGGATWDGLAALVNVDAVAYDVFQLNAVAGRYVCSQFGTRAFNFGQGYGGVIEYIGWESPNPLPLRRIAPLGILVSASEPYDHVLTSPDYYYAYAYSQNDNTFCVCYPARAENWVQGAGRGLGVGLAGLPIAFGTGLHLDAGGDDQMYAFSYAIGAGPPGQAQALTYAQGSALNGVGVIVNGEGDDFYYAAAFENGVNQPMDTVAQASASGTIGFLALVGAVPAVGILIDADGSDYYSEQAEGGCPDNAVIWVGQPMILSPCVNSSPPSSGRVLGVDVI